MMERKEKRDVLIQISHTHKKAGNGQSRLVLSSRLAFIYIYNFEYIFFEKERSLVESWMTPKRVSDPLPSFVCALLSASAESNGWIPCLCGWRPETSIARGNRIHNNNKIEERKRKNRDETAAKATNTNHTFSCTAPALLGPRRSRHLDFQH